MVIGEAPGRNEDAAGRPFVGRAGALLDRALKRALGTLWDARADVFVTNAVKCRPPSNRTPKNREVDICADAYLIEEVRRVDPVAVLVCGNAAMHAVFGYTRTGVSAYRGVWLDMPGREGRTTVMVTYHPAFLLYQGMESEAATQFFDDVDVWGTRVLSTQREEAHA